MGHGGGWAGIRLAPLYPRARVGLDPGQGRVPAGALPSRRAPASALNRGRGANPASGAHPGRLSGPAASSSPPRPSDSRGRPRPPFGPGLAAAAAATRQRSAASPSPGSRRGAVSACVAGPALVGAAFVCGRARARAAGQRACCRTAGAGGEPPSSQGAPAPALSPCRGWPRRREHVGPRIWGPEAAGAARIQSRPQPCLPFPWPAGPEHCGTCPHPGIRSRRSLGG